MKKYIFEITTFVSGALGMIIELVAARILSPYLGNSNLIWTCIIGMMLAFMSLGYYFGGKIADKNPKRNIMSLFLLNAAIFISIIPLLEVYVIEPLSKTSLSLPLVAIICSIITFGLPSLFLATVSPYAVKLKEKTVDEIGQVSGKMSSFSTIGSIVGTFLAGFLLIPKMGVKNIILMCVIVLCVMSFILYEKKNVKYIIKSVMIFILLIVVVLIGKEIFKSVHKNIILDTDSEYSRIWINKINDEMYALQVDTAYESVSTENNNLNAQYLEYYDLFDYYKEYSKDILMIGGAAYTYPSYFLEKYSEKNIDVVEIDPKMTEIANTYFDLDIENERLNIFHEDGRRFLNMSQKKYDCILIDAFKGLNVPFQLTTIEALQSVKNSLNENGIVITNLVCALDGKDSELVKYEYTTYKEVFENVKIFQVGKGNVNDTDLQNLILVCFNGEIYENLGKYENYQRLIENEILNFYSDKPPVTDDLCPVGI